MSGLNRGKPEIVVVEVRTGGGAGAYEVAENTARVGRLEAVDGVWDSRRSGRGAVCGRGCCSGRRRTMSGGRRSPERGTTNTVVVR